MSETRFVVRVDDVGQDIEQHKPDVRLLTFRRWLKAWGPIIDPMYLGVVPAILGPWEKRWLEDLARDTPVRLSIHGWAHDDRILTPGDVRLGHGALPSANSVIPPNNKYDAETAKAMELCGIPYLFGGFYGPHHGFGNKPMKIGPNLLHLPAYESLYRRSYALPEMLDLVNEYPVMTVTLHHRWDAQFIEGVADLGAAMLGRAVALEDIPAP